jgi:hypothetical protein
VLRKGELTMNEAVMKAGAALLTTLAFGAGACQLSLGLDDYAFAEPETGDESLLGQGGSGALPDEPTNGGRSAVGVNGGAGGDATGGASNEPRPGEELPYGMGGEASMPGTGGAGGAAGTGGATGTGGMTGVAGTEGGGGQGGGPAAPLALCTGCVELVVPVDGGGRTPFQFQLPEPADFSNGIVQWRIYSLEPNPAFFIKAAVQNGSANAFSGLFHQPGIPLDRVGWSNIELDVAASSSTSAPPGTELYTGGGGTFDKTQILLVGLEVGAFDDFLGTGEVRLLVDEVIISDVPGVASKTFAAGPDGMFADVSEGLDGSELIYHAEYVQ